MMKGKGSGSWKP